MRRISLEVSYIPYWTVGCVLLGVIFSPLITTHPESHSTHYTHDHNMFHDPIEVDPKSVPKIDIEIVKDAMAGWNLKIKTENFLFTPENVNLAHENNEGHAHIYVNGVKLTRLYSRAYHLSNFPPGEYEISVTLNSNDHGQYTFNGENISASQIITQNDLRNPL